MKVATSLSLGLAVSMVGLVTNAHADSCSEFDVNSNKHAYVFINILNTTSNDFTFNKHSHSCTEHAPDTFTVPANGESTFNFKFRFRDKGFDDCYAIHHDISWKDQNDKSNKVGVIEHASSNREHCIGYKYFAGAEMHGTICNDSSGIVYGGALPTITDYGEDTCNQMNFYFVIGKTS